MPILEIHVKEPVAILSQTNSHLETQIGEGVRTERTLRELGHLARSALDALSAHVAILDETGTIIAVNRAWRRFAEANGTTLTGLAEGANYLAVCDAVRGLDAEGAAAFAAGMRAILQGTQDEFVLEYPCHSPTERRWFIGRVTRFAGEGATRLVVAHEDITERCRAEAVLLESEERYRRVSEMIVDYAYSCLKPAGGAFAIDWLVGAVERISGYTADEVRSRGCWKCFVHPADHSIFENRVIGLNPGDSGACELRIVHKDGSIRWLRALSRVIEEGGDPLTHRLFGTCEDITERKRAEEGREQTFKELDRRRRELESLLYGATTVLEGADFAGTARRIFDAACKMTGAQSGYVALLSADGEENEVLFLESGGVPCTGDSSLPMPVRGLRAEAYQTGRTVLDSDFMYSRWVAFMPAGHVDLQKVMFAPLSIQGKIVGIMGLANKSEGFSEDDRRMAEAFGQLAAIALQNSRDREALQGSEMRYRMLVENANEAIFVAQDGMLRFVNPMTCQITGCSEDELLSHPFVDFIHRDDRSLVLDRHVRRLCGETLPARYKFRLAGKAGGTKWVEVGAVLIEWEGKAATLNFMTDINARKRAEEALREANEYLNNLIAYANAPIIVWDPEYRITRFNRAFEKLTGRASQEVIGQSLEILIPREQADVTMSFIKKTQPDERWETVEIGIQHIDGSVRSVLWNSATIFAADGITPVATIAQGYDITERKRVEEEKARLQSQTWQLQKAESLGRMAGAIAHHFNNQLQAVMGYLELAMDDLPPGDRPHAKVVEALKASGKASEISSLMLAYLGQASGNREPLDLSVTCRWGLPMLRSAMPEGIVLETDLPCPGPVVSANANQIQQVLTNLVTNAWEACGEGVGSIHLAVKTVPSVVIRSSNHFPIDWQPQESLHACLEVTDTGCGIEDKDIEKLFDPFFSSKFTGRGLGLAVVLGIVRAHRGAVTVESEPGRGSVFRVFFPVCAEEVPRRPDKPAQASKMERGGTVLLVEDDDMLRNMTESMLTSLGFTVLAAKDGIEAVEVFPRHRDEIRCVLLDLSMPRMDGWETLTALRALRSDLPVVLASGYDEARALQGEHPELPQAFLHKPYRMDDLKAALSKAQKALSAGSVDSQSTPQSGCLR